jgi:hypothetical protein
MVLVCDERGFRRVVVGGGLGGVSGGVSGVGGGLGGVGVGLLVVVVEGRLLGAVRLVRARGRRCGGAVAAGGAKYCRMSFTPSVALFAAASNWVVTNFLWMTIHSC